ncbi:MAG: hypothetical protein ACM3SY_01860 [Candidatus Omnitrophota bacterium]
MKKLKKILPIVCVNLLVFVFLLELVSLLVYLVKTKRFFYTDTKRVVAMDKVESVKERQLTDKRVHPFFGYTYRAGAGHTDNDINETNETNKTNNYGFICPYDVPLQRENSAWYFIGIFGGSVADDFYRLGTQRLTERLKRHPFFADKDLIFLNFAMGGYKQPQPLQIMTYFLSIGQPLDMALNIDGFNDLVFCFNNNRLGVDIGMPSAQHLLPLRDILDSGALTGEKLNAIWTIHQCKRRYFRMKDIQRHTPLASVYWMVAAVSSHLYRTYQTELARFDRLIDSPSGRDSILNVKFTPAIRDESLLLSEVTAFWSRCSRMMNGLMTAGSKDGIENSNENSNGNLNKKRMYFHFLQPNQYFSAKPFSAEETRSALMNDSAYAFLVKKGYPSLIREIANLTQNHVNAFDATGVFDTVRETIYIDNCCHFNELGNRLLADYMADGILKTMMKR